MLVFRFQLPTGGERHGLYVLSQVIEGSSYYGWNVKNGEGYILEIDETKWKEGQLDGTVTCGIDHRIYT